MPDVIETMAYHPSHAHAYSRTKCLGYITAGKERGMITDGIDVVIVVPRVEVVYQQEY